MKARKQEIIDAAISLFSKQGYKATTMRQLSKEAGIKTGGLYHYIGSKEQILYEIQTNFVDTILTAIKECPHTSSAQARLEKAVRAIIDAVAHNQKIWKILLTQLDSFPPPLREKIEARGRELGIAIKTIIEEGQVTGEFNDMNSRVVTSFIFGACHYVCDWFKEDYDANEIGKALSSLFLEGLLKQPRREEPQLGELVPTWA